MANKVVIVRKGFTEGVEYTLDVDTGTNLRGLTPQGGGQFIFALDKNKIAFYRMDAKNAIFRKIDSDVTTSGSDSDILGVTSSLGWMCWGVHNLRSGTNRENLVFARDNGKAMDTVSFNVGVPDVGNRIRGMEMRDNTIYYIFHQNSLPAKQLIRARNFPIDATSDFLSIDLGNSSINGLCLDAQDFTRFWTISSSKVLRFHSMDGTVIEQFTITNSGTYQDVKDLGDGRLAISAT